MDEFDDDFDMGDEALVGLLAFAWWKHDNAKKNRPIPAPQHTAAKAHWNAVVGEHMVEEEP